jgi:rhamnosyltransferase subunit B
MRCLLTSWGSHGDLHPFLALGRGLMARGHEVSLVGHPDWEAETVAAGLRFVSTGEPPRGDLIRDYPDLLSTKWGGLASLHTLIHRAIAPSFDPVLAVLTREAREHDALVAHHFVFTAPVVAKMRDIPWATVSLAPGVVPSDYWLPGAHFGRAGQGFFARKWNRAVWTAGKLITRRMVDPVVNDLRLRNGLKKTRDVTFHGHSPRLNLQLYSKQFAPPPPDLSREKRYAGFCFYDPPGEQGLPQEIEDFLAAGEPPVLFTLGSVAVRNPGPFYANAVEALQALSLRGILLTGVEENRPPHLPDTVIAAPYAPYGFLMPRVRAVAHQCGIGTLSHTLRAGVPSLAYPFAFDQPNNARRLEALGVAEVVLPRERIAFHMTRALERLLSGEAPARAQEIGARVREEDGVGRACEILEKTFDWTVAKR